MKMSWLIMCVALTAAGCAAQPPSAPQDSVGAAFQAAQDSTNALADFVRTHPQHPGLCGEALIRTGYLLEHRGDLSAAVEAYKTAIKDYGAALAPLRSANVTVADIARLSIAVCYKKMGKNEDALSAYNTIVDNALKAANRGHFIKGQDEKRIEPPAGGGGKPAPQP